LRWELCEPLVDEPVEDTLVDTPVNDDGGRYETKPGCWKVDPDYVQPLNDGDDTEEVPCFEDDAGAWEFGSVIGNHEHQTV